jgi:hypothetical protein
MAHGPIEELDVVALTVDLPSQRLARGQIGTVVHIYAPNAFEVEFVDNDGRTYALTTLQSDQVMRLLFAPATAA